MDSLDPRVSADDSQGPAADSRTPTWLVLLRVWAVLNLPLTLALAFAGLLLSSLARHGGGGSFGLGLFVFVASFALTPFGVFAPRRWPSHTALLTLGALCMFVTTLVAVSVGWQFWVQPSLVARNFEHATEALSIERWSAEPIELDGVAVGLRVTGVLRVAQDIPAKDRAGAVHAPGYSSDILTSAGLRPAGGAKESPLGPRRNIKLVPPAGAQRQGGVDLPAGEHLLSFELWRWGLEFRGNESVPCRRIMPSTLKLLAPLADTPSITLQLRVRLESVGGDGFNKTQQHELLGAGWSYAYDHQAWLEQLQRLPIEDCQAREDRAAAERKARDDANEQAMKERYLTASAPESHHELTRGCDGDVALLRKLLAYGLPAASMAKLVWRCGGGKREAFELLARTLYEVRDSRSDYCDGIQNFVARRDLAAMQRLSDAKLPVLCARREDFKALLDPINKSMDWAKTIVWLEDVQRMGLDLCAVGPGRQTLLQRVALREPEVVEFLLDQGCDPAVLPWPSASPDGQPYLSARLAWHSRVIQTSLDEKKAAPITQRIGAVDRLELTRVDPRTGVTGPLLLTPPYSSGSQTRLHPDVIVWLARQGARFDAADREGRSWYHSGYEQRAGASPPNHAINLKDLSPAQLRQLIRPRNLATGKPGIPLDGVADKSPNGLGGYLCSRGVGAC